MKTFVPAVLLGAAGRDAFRPNAETNPPHGEAAQTCQAGAAEGRTIVGADGGRETELAKGRGEDIAHVWAIRLRGGAAAQQVAAIGVGNGEGIATLAVAGEKPAFEIGAPHVIGRGGVCQRLGIGSGAAARRAGLRETLTAQQFADGAASRPGQRGPALFQVGFELFGTPARMLRAEAEDAAAQSFGHGFGLLQWGTALVRQARVSLGGEPFDPFVSGRSRDIEVTAERGEALLFA
jgi:hypothetical protein